VKINRRVLLQCLLLCILLAVAGVGAGADDTESAADSTPADPAAPDTSFELDFPRNPADLVQAALRYSPEYTRPVINADGSPVAVYHDLNGDGHMDVAILAVVAETGVPTQLSALRETARLFRNGGPQPLFILETYFAGGEAVQTVELGRRPALGGIELLPLSDSAPFPVAVALTTRGATGSETNLLVYSPGGIIRRVELRETERERFQFADLDEDGALDIVVTRRLPEAGRGYETFVELWTLVGNSYAAVESFGLVRELQLFLDMAADHVVAGRWGAVESLVRPGQDTGNRVALLSRTFTGVADDEETAVSEFDYPEAEGAVTAVVFPGIRENPIPYPYLGSHFTLVFRVECCDASPRFYSAIIEMAANPFTEPRFAFLTSAGAQQ
jgi:hypothetical protein